MGGHAAIAFIVYDLVSARVGGNGQNRAPTLAGCGQRIGISAELRPVAIRKLSRGAGEESGPQAVSCRRYRRRVFERDRESCGGSGYNAEFSRKQLMPA